MLPCLADIEAGNNTILISPNDAYYRPTTATTNVSSSSLNAYTPYFICLVSGAQSGLQDCCMLSCASPILLQFRAEVPTAGRKRFVHVGCTSVWGKRGANQILGIVWWACAIQHVFVVMGVIPAS